MVKDKNYFIKKKFRIGFLTRLLVLLLLESILIAGLFVYVATNTVTAGYFNSILKAEATPSIFFLGFLLIQILIIVVGVGIAGMVIYMLVSHRIEGPSYRFEKALKEMEAGDFTTRINLRKGDQLGEAKEALNILVGSLDKRISRIRNGLVQIQELLSKKDDPEAASKLNKAIGLLKNELEHFKTS